MSDTEDFAAMFEASLKAKRVEQGQTIEGTIVAIGQDVAFVDVGGKGEATIEVAELKDADGDIGSPSATASRRSSPRRRAA
jgi:small subunit ribosomal protein S1